MPNFSQDIIPTGKLIEMVESGTPVVGILLKVSPSQYSKKAEKQPAPSRYTFNLDYRKNGIVYQNLGTAAGVKRAHVTLKTGRKNYECVLAYLGENYKTSFIRSSSIIGLIPLNAAERDLYLSWTREERRDNVKAFFEVSEEAKRIRERYLANRATVESMRQKRILAAAQAQAAQEAKVAEETSEAEVLPTESKGQVDAAMAKELLQLMVTLKEETLARIERLSLQVARFSVSIGQLQEEIRSQSAQQKQTQQNSRYQTAKAHSARVRPKPSQETERSEEMDPYELA